MRLRMNFVFVVVDSSIFLDICLVYESYRTRITNMSEMYFQNNNCKITIVNYMNGHLRK